MGMFDSIKCQYPLPDREVQDRLFQTKDLLNMMDVYTITHEGRLIWHKTRLIEVPEEERPYYGTKEWEDPIFQAFGCMRSVPVADIDVHHHGIIYFYTYTGDINKDYTWYEYEAKFTDGTLVELKRVRGPHEEADSNN